MSYISVPSHVTYVIGISAYLCPALSQKGFKAAMLSFDALFYHLVSLVNVHW